MEPCRFRQVRDTRIALKRRCRRGPQRPENVETDNESKPRAERDSLPRSERGFKGARR
jgi:hypothetical protein